MSFEIHKHRVISRTSVKALESLQSMMLGKGKIIVGWSDAEELL
jgi:hypothetical protein